MFKLLIFIYSLLCLSTSGSCPALADDLNSEQTQARQSLKIDDESTKPDTTVKTSPDSTDDYRNKTNAAAELCRKAKDYSDCNQQEEARAILEQAVLLDPNANSHVVHNQLGLALTRLGEPKAALLQFSQALTFSPDNAPATLNMAECYKQLGQISEAKAYLRRFIAENPQSPQLAQAKASLDALRHTAKMTGDREASDYLNSVTKKGIIGWSQTKMPLRIFIQDGRGIFGYEDSFRNLIQKSLWQWAQASNGRVRWRLVYNHLDADIVFHWTSDKSDFPYGAEQGIAKLTWRSHCIQHADIKICTVSVVSNETKALPANEMEQTCLHEIGHALGLAGHSSNNNDVMFFCVRPYPVTALTERDKNAIARLYSHDFVEPRHGGGLTIGIPGLFGVRF